MYRVASYTYGVGLERYGVGKYHVYKLRLLCFSRFASNVPSVILVKGRLSRDFDSNLPIRPSINPPKASAYRPGLGGLCSLDPISNPNPGPG